MFKIDWYKFVLHNIPPFKREKTRVQWLSLLISPFQDLWNEFEKYRAAKLYDINHTGQVIYLEKALNDVFDPQQRRIYIEDGDFADRIYEGDRVTDPVYSYHRWGDGGFLYPYPLDAEVLYMPDMHIYRSKYADNEQPPSNLTYWEKLGPHPYLKYRSDYTYGFGFIVYVPITLTFNEARMRALIDFRKVAGRPYKIELI